MPARGSSVGRGAALGVGLGPGVEVSVGVGEGGMVGVSVGTSVAVGGEVQVGGIVGATARVWAASVAVRSNESSGAGRLQAARSSPAAKRTVQVFRVWRLFMSGLEG